MSDGWQALSEAVATARAEIAAAAPDAATAVEGEAYVMRVLGGCLNDAFLGHHFVEDGFTRALPVRGGPNPDYRMLHAGLDPARRYRLEGILNGSERVGVGVYAFGKGGSTDLLAYTAFDAASADAAGRFALDIAADATGPGTLTIPAGARVVMTRTLHRDATAAPARLRLQGGDPVRDLALAMGSTEAATGRVAGAMLSAVRTFLEWSKVTGEAANRFYAETPDMAQGVVGDPGTIYFLGGYQLAEGEWLEIVLPGDIPGYWSIHAYNHWCEGLPGAGVGDHVAVADTDGRVRIAVGLSVGGHLPNVIDTLGRRRGALIARFIGAKSVGVPETHLHGSADGA